MFKKRSVFIAAAVVALLTLVAGGASAQLAGTVKDVEQPVGLTGKIDWTTGVITVTGTGVPNPNAVSAAQARTGAERAAKLDAYRNLLESLKGVRIDSETTVENSITTSDVIKSQVSGFVQGATLMDTKYMSDGAVQVTLGMKLTGALADTFLPKGETPPAVATAPTGTSAVPGQVYTGLIVDARGLGVRPAMAPKILNEDGKEVYGSAWINRDFAVREGMVGYLKDPAAAQANPRVADRPLMVKALKVAGSGRVDLVISNADAASLQSASQNLSMLEKCRVIILVD
jgi:hypothetical protein